MTRTGPGSSIRWPRSALSVTSSIPLGSRPDRARRRQRRERVAAHVRGGEGQLADRPRSRDVAALAEGHDPSRRRAGGGRAAARPPAARRSRPGAARRCSSALAAAIASSEPSSSRWTGPTLTMTPTSGSAIAASSAIWPLPRIAISSTSACVPAGAPRIVQRQPDLRVEVLRRWRRSRRSWRSIAAQQVLRRGLAGRAGDRDDLRAELAPPRARQRLQRRQRVVGDEHRARARARARLLGVLGRDEHAPGAGVRARCGGEAPAVGARAGQADEQVAGADVARVDRHAQRTGRSALRGGRGGRSRERGARGRRDALRRPVAHAAPRERR